MYGKQQGFMHLLIVVVVALALVVSGGLLVLSRQQDTDSSRQDTKNPTSDKIKHIGIEIGQYDPSTGMAGDFKFTKAKFNSGIDMLLIEYGYTIKAENSSSRQDKTNPQPTFIVPLGTKVRSLVDGTVVNVPELYSKDFSIHVQPEGSELVFETEHVKNVLVKKGDKVKAGDVIAEVSDYDARNFDGLGLFEIGILKPGNPPSHVCPFDYLDDSIKQKTLDDIAALKKAWEDYRGDQAIYDETNIAMPGCVSMTPVEG